MLNSRNNDTINPIAASERFVVLDALRGMALLGICLANFPELSLYSFQSPETIAAMPSAAIDRIIRYIQLVFIDGKFYSLFSLLFGIGFSIIISNAMKKGANGMAVFYRRMLMLALIGFLHLMFIWSGDILLLYALLGMLLPLFINVSDKKLLVWSGALLLFPIAMDTIKALTDNCFNLAQPVIDATQYFNAKNGITDENFPVWLRDSKTYSDVFKFLISGAFIRCQEFIEWNRIFKVLGLFLLGLYVGRKRIYADIKSYSKLLRQIRLWGFGIALPLSCVYAWNSMSGAPFGEIFSAVIYAVSVVPLSLAYASAILLWYDNHRTNAVFRYTAAPGRMAATNYILQSVIGMFIYYGIGFGLGASMGLAQVEAVAACVFVIEIAISVLWLHYFRFGPVEWIWRMATYRKVLKLTKL